jgi:hypothetical protein
LSTSAVRIASATPAKSIASSETTRDTRHTVAMRSSNVSAGGRLRRMSWSERSMRRVVAESVVSGRRGPISLLTTPHTRTWIGYAA